MRKTCRNDLAIHGGQPAFDQPLHVGRPNLAAREALLAGLGDVFDRCWLTNNGPSVQELEKRVAELLGVKHCIVVCNGTVGLEIAIRAQELSGEVIIPSYTFVATAHALQWQQITPVFCDVDPRTYTIDPDRVRELITPRTSGIIGVHLWGNACNTHALTEIARERGLRLIFDAAHAFMCSHEGRMIGNFGNAEVFSFHATKFFNTGEGGAIVTNDDALAAKIRLMVNFGFAGFDKVIYIGTNGKMSELSAAVGLANLAHIDEFVATNRRNYELYAGGLACIPGVSVVRYPADEKKNFQYVVLEIDQQQAGIDRDRLAEVLWAENVLARRYFYPGCHRMEPYRSYYPHAGLLLPKTEELLQKVLCLPTGTAVDSGAINAICQIIRVAVAERA